jgi:sugar-specific transcriptional regulator TrmB
MISETQLKALGFSEKEAKVYFALLQLGPATATKIAEKAQINRTTGYDILESLAHDGLVMPIGEAKVQRFVAENPQKVIAFLENKIKDAEQKIQQARVLMPELLSIFQNDQKPALKFFENVAEIRKLIDSLTQAKQEIVIYSATNDPLTPDSQKVFAHYTKTRTRSGQMTRIIAPSVLDEKQFSYNAKKVEIAYIPADLLPFTTETIIIDDRMIMISWKDLYAVSVENAAITDTQKRIFELAWMGAKQFS